MSDTWNKADLLLNECVECGERIGDANESEEEAQCFLCLAYHHDSCDHECEEESDGQAG